MVTALELQLTNKPKTTKQMIECAKAELHLNSKEKRACYETAMN